MRHAVCGSAVCANACWAAPCAPMHRAPSALALRCPRRMTTGGCALSWRTRMPPFLLVPPANSGRPSASAHEQRGAAAVEFALILPILLMVLLGIIEMSLALYDKAIITNASREGARAGIVLSSPKMTEAQIRDVVLTYTNGALLSLGASTAPTVTVVLLYSFR